MSNSYNLNAESFGLLNNSNKSKEKLNNSRFASGINSHNSKNHLS